MLACGYVVAPNLPVHLGSMSEAVRWQIHHLGDSWKEGEVILTNHPASGGSHLPDITIITPVWDDGRVVFFVASRGHHADIGGFVNIFLRIYGASLKPFETCQSYLLMTGRFSIECGWKMIVLFALFTKFIDLDIEYLRVE